MHSQLAVSWIHLGSFLLADLGEGQEGQLQASSPLIVEIKCENELACSVPRCLVVL